MSAASVFARASRGLAQRGAWSGARTQTAFGSRIPALSALARYYASGKSYPSHTVISMPALSPTMTSGNIGSWQKQPGDSLAPGDVLVEIETDKAQMDFEFQEEGVLAKILKDSGEKDVPVGNPIAVLVEDAGDVSAFEDFSIEDAGGEKAAPKEDKKGGQEAAEATESPDSGSGTAPPKGKQESAPQAQESESSGERLEPTITRWKGPKAQEAAKSSGSGAVPAVAGVTSPATYEDIEPSSMRKTIASRLTQSFQQNPHYFVASTVSVTKLLKLRQALNASADGKYKLSVNDFLVKALAYAARKVPAANSSWREIDGKVVIRQNNVVDVSVAVATPVGLMTPIVKNVTGTGLETVSAQIKDLGKRARDGKLKPEEYQGGTITISNMGMNDAIDRFTAIINPPQATILAVGAVKKVAVPKDLEEGAKSFEWDDQIVLTASFDHKVVDGAVGGEFMKELKKVIENPLEMLL
ncbi:Dihydrolipoyllysine-residue acetyltransferase, mitochondrial [Fulvia fulva]|uniref:Dihydrolipoamide acetyltransferase component of pyruvate dehydrogenase complex n=1 Tax=Passalora fulva TaxID=5499 RepID=A0A9Q8LAT6_PASFU|nr:Dihydrolipoyllysine-residue acetyltransferase, mitochondrial [Fulvia fulva]KAK4631000.1 Dihydrolipoyllysine-residue acetyltransferase, mitochondrial [Fulvia fulva]KAK4633135.1 Dihydrolipoyllysine-residue acetyltransferase, mitochondrial [Fulvia fulva]UJO14013.1 Dihydrolipoyllysine-residue acetyltransferase, mitochondrial [Fulvia fulva]WPV11602.1 Dihydrolipoyllysine-residue acetyltransferase, mitochondrial [Fulvia fulva]WPV26058.1 Dihydrolipoyllysine-residue acetyltransferase, mitochondrial 